ncbi:MAG: hypothetical protein AAFZ15_03320, partial [Bacteroidota bacterium]
MEFKGIQQTFRYTQINYGSMNEIFPLLCPVRETDWLDGWTYQMIYSKSGLIEKNCVFSTPHHGELETIWHVTQHDEINHRVEFLRVTPKENVVRINIRLEKINDEQTRVFIDYQYTALNESQNNFIKTELQNIFNESM